MRNFVGSVYKIECWDEIEGKRALPVYFIVNKFDTRKVIEKFYQTFPNLRLMTINAVNNFSLDKFMVDDSVVIEDIK